MKNFRFGLLEAFVLFILFLFLADTGLQYPVSTSNARKASREVLNQTTAVIEHETASIRESTEYFLSRTMNSEDLQHAFRIAVLGSS